jgi:hypothetical protein
VPTRRSAGDGSERRTHSARRGPGLPAVVSIAAGAVTRSLPHGGTGSCGPGSNNDGQLGECLQPPQLPAAIASLDIELRLFVPSPRFAWELQTRMARHGDADCSGYSITITRRRVSDRQRAVTRRGRAPLQFGRTLSRLRVNRLAANCKRETVTSTLTIGRTRTRSPVTTGCEFHPRPRSRSPNGRKQECLPLPVRVSRQRRVVTGVSGAVHSLDRGEANNSVGCNGVFTRRLCPRPRRIASGLEHLCPPDRFPLPPRPARPLVASLTVGRTPTQFIVKQAPLRLQRRPRAIFAGGGTSLAVRTDGQLFAWGTTGCATLASGIVATYTTARQRNMFVWL